MMKNTEDKEILIQTTKAAILDATQRIVVLIEEIENPKIQKAAKHALSDKRFYYWPASVSRSKHHAYFGGLIVHTVEVMKLAKAMSLSSAVKSSLDIVLCAAVWHDFGKIADYNIKETESDNLDIYKNTLFMDIPYYTEVRPADNFWEYSWHHDHIRHVSLSYAKWLEASGKCDIPVTTVEHISHCILSHHGRKEWGSPIEPQTVEAQILHSADFISSRFGCNKI